MVKPNPYESPSDAEHGGPCDSRMWGVKRCAWIGLIVGVTTPIIVVAIGAYAAQLAADRLEPNQARCGMGGVVALMVMMVGIPLGGVIGNVAGRLIAVVHNRIASNDIS